jgi:hypothetical protein
MWAVLSLLATVSAMAATASAGMSPWGVGTSAESSGAYPMWLPKMAEAGVKWCGPLDPPHVSHRTPLHALLSIGICMQLRPRSTHTLLLSLLWPLCFRDADCVSLSLRPLPHGTSSASAHSFKGLELLSLSKGPLLQTRTNCTIASCAHYKCQND